MLAEAPNSNALSMIGSQTRCLKLIPNALYSNVSELGGDLFPLLVEIIYPQVAPSPAVPNSGAGVPLWVALYHCGGPRRWLT